jgi:hypothetical protein
MYDMGICFNLSIEISQLIGSAPQVRALALLYLPIQISVLNITFLKSSGHGCPIEENVQGRMFFRI